MSRILAVEDDRIIGRVLEVTLRLAGNEVELVPRLSAARRALEAGHHDLVLTDICLPDGLGFELLQFLHDRLDRTTPVVVLSGLGQDVNVRRAMDLGAVDFMQKPFSPSDLRAKLAPWLEGHPAVK